MSRALAALANWWDLLGGSEEFPDVFAPQPAARPAGRVARVAVQPLGPRALPAADPTVAARLAAEYDDAVLAALLEEWAA